MFLLGIAVGIVGFVFANYVETGVEKALTEEIFMSSDFQTIELVNAIHRDVITNIANSKSCFI